MSIGIWQVLLILVIVLILFGAGKLPKVMGDIAKGVKNFKTGMREVSSDAPVGEPVSSPTSGSVSRSADDPAMSANKKE